MVAKTRYCNVPNICFSHKWHVLKYVEGVSDGSLLVVVDTDAGSISEISASSIV